MVAWFVISVIVVAVPRFIFFPAQPIPYCVQLNPGSAMIPVVGILFGPAGAWGGLVATVLVDCVIGMGSRLTPFRAVGVFLFAYSAQMLWSAFKTRSWDVLTRRQLAWRFVLVSLPGCFINSVWLGFGSEWMRFYPFPYVALLTLLPQLVFVPLVGVPLFTWLMIHVVPERGSWQSAMHGAGELQTRRAGALLVWLSAIGALCVGTMVSYTVYNIRPLAPFIIGVTNCPWTIAAVVPLLFLQLVGLFGFKSVSR